MYQCRQALYLGLEKEISGFSSTLFVLLVSLGLSLSAWMCASTFTVLGIGQVTRLTFQPRVVYQPTIQPTWFSLPVFFFFWGIITWRHFLDFKMLFLLPTPDS